MKKLFYAAIALMVSVGFYKVSAQQAGAPLSQTNGAQSGGNGQAGPPHGPPPNVAQALALLDQARQQSSGATASLIDQAEELLKRPPPHRVGGQGGEGQGGQNGGPGQQGQMQGPPH